MLEVVNDPAWDGARNVADLGGLPLVAGGSTARGRVFRSAAPEWMTTQGWDEARAAGLTAVIDLRNEMERGRGEAHPVLGPGAMAGISVVHAPTENPHDEHFLAQCGPWLDHPRSWSPNLRLCPDKIARALTVIAEVGNPLLLHCAGGRDRTGMIGSMLLVLAGATTEAIVTNYEAGFRGAALHRGHGWAYQPETGQWVPPTDDPWTEAELIAALAERRPALLQWIGQADLRADLFNAGVSNENLTRIEQLLIN